MRVFVTAAIIFAWFSAQATATENPLSAAQFERYTTGKTLVFLDRGQPYGVEQYRTGRRVSWAFIGGECVDGKWFEPENGLICFLYETPGDTQQCWNFFLTESGLRAQTADGDNVTQLYEAVQSPDPLVCRGPKIGA